LLATLRSVYDRHPPAPWQDGGNLPWDEPEFSARMLREHLDQSHGAASRRLPEIGAQVERMLEWLQLGPANRLFDVTCGPGLYAHRFAQAGISVTGIDFSPASIAYARRLCQGQSCEFIQGDVREMDFAGRHLDAAIYLYGQFAVLPPSAARDVLHRVHAALRPGARLLIELLAYEPYDKADGAWWYTDRGGLWGDFPYLHLGERKWHADERVSVERFHIVDLESGAMRVYTLSDQAYRAEDVKRLLCEAGFANVQVHVNWDGLGLRDAKEWVVYVAEKRGAL